MMPGCGPSSDTAIIPVVQRRDYYIGLEKIEGHTFIHASVFAKWSPQVKRAFQRDLETLFDLHGGPIHVATNDPHGGDYRKWAKFLTLMGFRFNCMFRWVDGVERPVFTYRSSTCH
jgi:hypothetical protein